MKHSLFNLMAIAIAAVVFAVGMCLSAHYGH